MKTLYLECNMGAAGDMLMAALFELLSPEQQKTFLETMNHLLPGVTVTPHQAQTCGITGTHMDVLVHGEEEHSHDVHDPHHPHDHVHCHDHGHDHIHLHDHDHEHHHDHDHPHDHAHHHDHDHPHSHAHHHHASLPHIRGILAGLSAPEGVKEQAAAVYSAIARAESAAHGCPVEEVHFHEVGALDAVADVTGVCLALSMLRPDRIVSSPIHVGSGMVRCAHGVMPVPAPATAFLLKGIPTYGGEVQGELCTPTGAALIAHFAQSYGPMPAMAAEAVGYGVGKKVFERANCVRAFWGESAEQHAPNGEITELVCNLDDMTPEALAFACKKLLELGALDVYTLPGQMKKGRPGWVLTVLCEPDREEALAVRILRETTTNGLRARRCAKYFLRPTVEEQETAYGPIRVKKAEGYGLAHQKPEFEDVAAAARKSETPFYQVYREIDR